MGTVTADRPRGDIGRNCGFRFVFPGSLGGVRKARVYFADSGVDLSNSPFDRRYHLEPPTPAERAWAQSLDLPPPDQMRLIGSNSPEIFVAQGTRIARVLSAYLCEFFGEIRAEHRILDLGCGVGRSLLPLSRRHAAQWHGCDVNDRAIAYLQRAAPDIEARVSAYDPPLPYADETFDCVISVSVWTHLPLGMQLPWLAEVKRVLRRGGLALISTHGPHVIDVCRKTGDPGWVDLSAEDLAETGFYYRPYANASLSGVTSSYGMAMHDPEHVRRVWSQILPVLKTGVRALEAFQDLHAMTKL
jgi:SAM-dependent methyltransferase